VSDVKLKVVPKPADNLCQNNKHSYNQPRRSQRFAEDRTIVTLLCVPLRPLRLNGLYQCCLVRFSHIQFQELHHPFKGKADHDLRCGQCGAVLAEKVDERQFCSPGFLCGGCDSYNDTVKFV
jgi:hypothetical protein